MDATTADVIKTVAMYAAICFGAWLYYKAFWQ